MKDFNSKSLVFYGIAIVSVGLLFQIVTSYGEANVKAPSAISGRYRLQRENLPKCLKFEPLILNIEQSGIYVNGALLPERILTSAEEKLSLSGLFKNNSDLSLSGSVSQLRDCNSSENQTNNLVTIEANWKKEKLTNLKREKLAGKITLNSSQKVINFVALKEIDDKNTKQEH